jgi:hypothetical protein
MAPWSASMRVTTPLISTVPPSWNRSWPTNCWPTAILCPGRSFVLPPSFRDLQNLVIPARDGHDGPLGCWIPQPEIGPSLAVPIFAHVSARS